MTSRCSPADPAATRLQHAGQLAPCSVQPGQLLADRYRIEREVGRGGMGVVYQAQHVLTGRPVAVKLLTRSHLADERALNEARSAASVRHPNVVEVLDVGLHYGSPFLVMELLTGRALSSDPQAAQDVSLLLSWLLPILGAVAALHDRGFVHGDLKPANVLLHRDGERIVPKLVDFGLASALFDRSLLSAPLYGTPRYMAPERAAGADLTVQADVWSMGMTLLECLAGTTATPGNLSACRPDLPEPLVRAIERALQPELRRRHATIRALARGLVEACCLAGITLPDDPDPDGLSELPGWRDDVQRGLLSETHSVESEQLHKAPRKTRTLRWAVPCVLALLTLAGWARCTGMDNVTTVHAPAPLPPTLPSVPAADEPAAERAEPAPTSAAPSPRPAARRVRAGRASEQPEAENDDITGDWR